MDNMSRKSLFNDRLSFKGPGIEGKLPHHVNSFRRRCLPQVVFLSLLGKTGDPDGARWIVHS